MRQFIVVANPDPESNQTRPFLVVLQSHYLETMETVVVAPLALADAYRPTPGLHPRVRVDDAACFVITSEMFAVARRALGAPVADLNDRRDDLLRGVDLVFLGF